MTDKQRTYETVSMIMADRDRLRAENEALLGDTARDRRRNEKHPISDAPTLLAAAKLGLDAMDDMATDVRLLEMTNTRVGQFEYARDTLRAALAAPQGEPVLAGRWHHGNGVLCSGSLRIARADFDTNPPLEMQERIFDDICEAMNRNLITPQLATTLETPEGWKLVPVEPNEAMQYAGGAAIGGMPSNLEDADRAYRAMIAAASTLPTSTQPAPTLEPLTVEEYAAIAHRVCSVYRHADDHGPSYTFVAHTLEQFVRAVENACVARLKTGGS